MKIEVPLVELDHSLNDYLAGAQSTSHSAEMVKSIGDSLRKWGFVSLSGHGIDSDLLDRAYQAAQKTFALSEAEKQAYEDIQGGRQRGYTPLLKEKAKGQQTGDLKEFWHVGRQLAKDHPHRISNLMRDNLYPGEVPIFEQVMQELYGAMDQLAHQMLGVIENYLDIDKGALSALADQGNSVLRVLHYPEMERFGSQAQESVRAAAHEDINLLTLLPAATQPGLQLFTPEGEWLDISPPAGAIVLDTGDMMTALTGGLLPATTHRVINPQGESKGARLSMPFFMHPRPNAVLNPLITSDQVIEGQGLTAQAFLDRRLAENGLV